MGARKRRVLQIYQCIKSASMAVVWSGAEWSCEFLILRIKKLPKKFIALKFHSHTHTFLIMPRHHLLLLLLLLLVLAMGFLTSFLHIFNTFQHSSSHITTTTTITPITTSLHVLFSSDLDHNWGSYQMRANQMADEINQMGPNYMASHIYAAAATTNHHHHLHGRKQTSHHACISIKSVSIYIFLLYFFFFYTTFFDIFSNHSSLSLCFLYIRLIHRCQHGVATYNMPSTCLI